MTTNKLVWNEENGIYNVSPMCKLKVCPFCGSDSEMGLTSMEYVIVKCTKCFLVTTDSHLIGTGEAEKFWNKRVDNDS